MTMRETIQRMESQLKDAGASVSQLCDEAKIKRSTWTRWKAAKVAPNMATWERTLSAFENLLQS